MWRDPFIEKQNYYAPNVMEDQVISTLKDNKEIIW